MAALLLVNPRRVVRDDGRHIAIFKQATFSEEIRGIISVITDRKIIIMLPAMFVAEMCLALISSINGRLFNLRTRSLSNLLFQVIMIPAPMMLAWLMDNQRIASRRKRGLLGVAAVGVVTICANTGVIGWIVANNMDERSASAKPVDWTDKAFAPAFVLYLLYGIIYACFQIVVQWTLSCLTNEPSLCARYAGAFKGTVSLGMCISFIVDSQGVSYLHQAIMQLVLYSVGLGCLVYVISVYVKETNYLDEATVIIPEAVENSLHEKGLVKVIDETATVDEGGQRRDAIEGGC